MTEVEILLVEDKQSDAEITIRAIRKSNIHNHITHLKDGKEALDFLFGTGTYTGRNVRLIPKLILLDLKMPKVNGVEVLEIIKQHELTKKIPVVMLTSSKEHPDIQQCYLYGVNSYVVKPVAFDDFIKTVSDLGIYWMLHNTPPQE